MMINAYEVRDALRSLPEVASQENLNPPSPQSVYVPRLHAKALGPDASVVSGMRGAGKSWWTAVLADDNTRKLASELSDDPQLRRLSGRVGFGLNDTNIDFPNSDAMEAMMASGTRAIDIWWAVVLRHAVREARMDHIDVAAPWPDLIARWAADSVSRDEVLTDCDDRIAARDRVLVVLLDSLDRISSEWDTVRSLTRAALEVCLRLRSRRAIRLKLFLRPDLEEDDRIWHFPDASKLRQGRVSLNWPVADLYGLLWTRLANDLKIGHNVRSWLEDRLRTTVSVIDGIAAVPPLLGESCLQELTEAIASPFMGRDRKRGLTFRWIPLHLADAHGRVSPRSWLLAFRRAAEETDRNRPQFEKALHYEGIQQGVVAASEIRVVEITEDHPWVKPLLEAARNLTVPCEPSELMSRWSPADLPRGGGSKLPPRRFTTDMRAGDPEALIDDLAALAVLYRTEDGRLNLPDIFRVGFGIKRKGGVKPPR